MEHLFRYEVFEVLMGAHLDLKFNNLQELSFDGFSSIKEILQVLIHQTFSNEIVLP